ncbi:MAG: ATP-binding protein [Solirubrobacteraceae bacterium]|nr:ATP-binding protein [Solirubrobacteraceae bacterium]
MAAELSVEVPRSIDAPSVVRHAVNARCCDELPAQQLTDLLIVVSELTTNAVRYGVGEIRLRVSVAAGHVYGEVIDEGRGFVSDVRDHGIEDVVGKRGLLIVGGLTERWGIHTDSSHVWFELLPSEADGTDDPQLRREQRPPELD